MELLKKTPNIDFVSRRHIALTVSAIAVVLSLVLIVTRGFNFGLEFTGGVLVEVTYLQPVELDTIRDALAAEGYEEALVQNFGTPSEVLIRLPPLTDEGADPGAAAAVGERVLGALQQLDPSVTLRRTEVVSAQVGGDLAEQGSLAALFALLMIFGYVGLRFRWKFAAASIVGLAHDGIITAGVFSLTGWLFDLSVLAALLAMIGYSLNDTIVVFDRVRENFRLMRRGTAEEIINGSINQTLARTIMTGITTLLVLFGLVFLGGETLFGFAMALIIGILVGTYSTIFVCCPVALLLKVAPSDLAPPKREAVDELP